MMSKRIPHEITLGQKDEVFLDTPAGFVRITMVTRRRIRIEAPDSITVSRGQERAEESAKFTALRDGREVPKYRMLVPMLGEHGELEGVTPPAVLSLR